MSTDSDDHVTQLERLAQLHERGLLSDAEFERAKRRLLSDPTPAESISSAVPTASERRLGAKEWLATGAATLAVLLLAGYSLGISRADADVETAPTVELEPELTAAEEPSPPAPTNLCGSSENYAQIKDMVFEKAVDVMGGDPVPLNSLKKSVSVRMELPVVSAIDDKVQRTDCTGRLVLDLPPGTREAFGGEKSLEADLEYSFQPAADGNGYVIRAEGFGYMTQRLIAAASLVNAQRVASQGGPQLQTTYNPSFDCGRSLTNVERMICQNEQLAGADRLVSQKFADLRDTLPPSSFVEAKEAQREFLKERGSCADVACVRNAYVSQWGVLRGIETSASPADSTGEPNGEENEPEPL